jgi:hypothetical protein
MLRARVKKNKDTELYMSFGIKWLVIYQKKSWICVIASVKRILIF